MGLQGTDFYWAGSVMVNCLVHFSLSFVLFFFKVQKLNHALIPLYLYVDYFCITK